MTHRRRTLEGIGEFGLVVEEAGRLALKLRDSNLHITEKRDHQDIVTVGDRAVEERLVSFIKERWPTHGIRGEEGASHEGTSGEWIIDPIETTNYVGGLSQFAISAGFLEGGVPIAGVVRFPAENRTVLATSTYVFDRKRKLRAVPFSGTLSEALVSVGLRPEHNKFFSFLRPTTRNVLMFGSCVWETVGMVLNRGSWAATLHTGATPYDLAAVVCIARTAGCTVASLNAGEGLDFSQSSIPFVAGRSAEIVQAIQKIWANWIAGQK